MSVTTRIRHSFIGRSVRTAIHAAYRLRHRDGNPVEYRLPGGVGIQLFPEGEIVEFLSVQRFFEKTELALVSAYLKPGMRAVDVGANIGLYSILAERLVGREGTVWALEPSTESFDRLRKNLSLNGCRRVHAARVALSDRTETFRQLTNDSGFGDAYRYLVPSDATPCPDHGAELVPVTTLDLFAEENAIDSIEFLKVDVEGGEYLVFEGGKRLLQSSPNLCIMFESDPEWCERARCQQQDALDLLRGLGFGLYSWRGRSREWVNDGASLLTSGTVWACRDSAQLPVLKDG
jgi:FkbM family methyltransferase